MSDPSPIAPDAPSRSGGEFDPVIREATEEDVAGVVAGIELLLVELGGSRPSREDLEAATRGLIGNPSAGMLLVADVGGEIVGVLAASWQHAIHVPGRYGTIQDLWVLPAWRSRAIGHDLVESLCVRARERGVPRLEVGLPQEGFEQLDATEAFYRNNAFEPLGPRMRRRLT